MNNLIKREISIFGKPLAEIKVTLGYLTETRELKNKKINTKQCPLEKLFYDYHSAIKIDAQTPLHKKVQKVDKEADVRNIWFRVMKKLSPEEFDQLMHHKIFKSDSFRDIMIDYNLLPEDKKVSYRIKRLEVDHNLGLLSLVPPEISIQIFQHLSFFDISNSASVSKYWFQFTTSRQVWASRSPSSTQNSDPFTSVQHLHHNNKIWTSFKAHYIYATDVEVTHGEGRLVCEQGYLQGIKLNGQPIISAWFNETGSLARCMVRSNVVNKAEMSFAVKNIEAALNEGTLDFLALIYTLAPFLNCLSNGRYRIRVQSCLNCWLFEYNSSDDLNRMAGDCSSDDENIYCTQPSDLLSEERIKFYEDQIKQGKRPIVLAIKGSYDYFVIDGHHKLKAYYNLNMEQQMVMITVEAWDPKKISKQEELEYVQHSPNGVESFNASAPTAHKQRY